MKSATLYVPMMNSNITPENRAEYTRQLRAIGADTVFISLDYFTLFSDDRTADIRLLEENINYFRSCGFTVGVWIQAFGFGGELTSAQREKAKGWTVLRSVCGNVSTAFCPEDPEFRRHYMNWVTDVARCAPDMIMLDDDLCQSVRPGIGCTCDRHRALFAETLEKRGLEPMPEDTALWPSLLFSGTATPRRRAFLDVMGDSLRNFCRAVRKTVDTVDPHIRVGFCAGYTSWDIEGADAAELSHILAGASTKPFLRLTGAPYWVSRDMHRFEGQRLNTVIEMVRMQEKWCRDDGREIEIFCEADSYPRPRYHVPAAYLECFDLACRAGGGMGTLKYVFDYYAPMENETGYIKHHLRNQPLYEITEQIFADKQARGVYVYEPMRKIADMTLPEPFAGEGRVMESAFSPAASLLSAHSIPTTYDDIGADCAIAFGAAAADAVKTLPKKLILDLPAAKQLAKAGVDVGLCKAKPAEKLPLYERYTDLDRAGSNVPGHTYLQFQWGTQFEICTLDDRARLLSIFETEDTVYPSAYRYTSGDTEFYVLCVDAAALRPNCSLLLSYGRQAQLLDFIGPIPHIKGQPGIYALWKENDTSGCVLFLNLSEDSLFDFEIVLDRAYENMRLIGVNGVLLEDRIRVEDTVAPYSAVIVEFGKALR